MTERIVKPDSSEFFEEKKREKQFKLAQKLWEKSVQLKEKGIIPQFLKRQRSQSLKNASLESLTLEHTKEAVSLLVRKHILYFQTKEEKVASEKYFQDCCEIATERESGFVFIYQG